MAEARVLLHEDHELNAQAHVAEPQRGVAALRLVGVGRRFGGVAALTDVSLDVAPGARHGIIGPNGAGKTTLFNIISGELKPTGGKVELFAQDMTRASPPRRVELGLGRTYQVTRTFSSLTVRENLNLAAHGLRGSKFSMLRPWTAYAGCTREVEELAETLGLDHRLDAVASDLSHGEIRQLEVALALALSPRLLLLDEPGAGLSPAERVEMREFLKKLPDDVTLLMIEHDMDLVRELVSAITVLHYGQVVCEGSTEEVQQDPKVREVYLGEDR